MEAWDLSYELAPAGVPTFAARLPLTSRAIRFASRVHRGQRRESCASSGSSSRRSTSSRWANYRVGSARGSSASAELSTEPPARRLRAQ